MAIRTNQLIIDVDNNFNKILNYIMPRITINDEIINKNVKNVKDVQPGVTLKVKYYSNDIAKLYFTNKFGEKQIIHERFNRDKFHRLALSEKYRQRQRQRQQNY